MTSSDVFPAGICWAVTFSSGCWLFHAATTSSPHATSSGLVESQISIGPREVFADSGGPPPSDRQAVSKTDPTTAARTETGTRLIHDPPRNGVTPRQDTGGTPPTRRRPLPGDASTPAN